MEQALLPRVGDRITARSSAAELIGTFSGPPTETVIKWAQVVRPDEWGAIRSKGWAGLKRLGSHGMAGTPRPVLQYRFRHLGQSPILASWGVGTATCMSHELVSGSER